MGQDFARPGANRGLSHERSSMLLGYLRVSKADRTQSLDLQQDALLAAGVDPARLYTDTASGRLDDRPGLEGALKALRPGDTLVVWKLDRLGRSLRHLVNTVHALTERGIGLRVLTGHGASLDTTRPEGKLVFRSCSPPPPPWARPGPSTPTAGGLRSR